MWKKLTIFQKALFIHKELSCNKFRLFIRFYITINGPIRWMVVKFIANNIFLALSEFLSYGLGNPPSCREDCKFLWDGFGRWSDGTWRPHVKGIGWKIYYIGSETRDPKTTDKSEEKSYTNLT